jgi:rubrerythrin
MPQAAMQPQMATEYMDPPAATATSPEMQQFMEQNYLMGPNCFGSDSQKYSTQIMQYINDEYHDYLYYTILSRRAPTANGRRIFRNIAAAEMKHARLWASAYFLIIGKRYFPTRSMVGPVKVPTNYSQALRERYMSESADALKYRQFAAGTTDHCLKRMATDISDDERQHAQDILGLIQNL